MRKIFQFVLGVTVVAAPCLNAAPQLTLNPLSGAIVAAPGATNGWGFTLTNTTDFLQVNQVEFCIGAATPSCNSAIAGIGSFTDFLGSRPVQVIVGPAPESTVVTEAFDFSLQLGVGGFTFDPGVAIGTSLIGKIFLTYSLYSRSPNDPNFDPTTDSLFNGDTFNISSNASITAAAATVVPEPATSALLLTALSSLGLWRLRRKTSRR